MENKKVMSFLEMNIEQFNKFTAISTDQKINDIEKQIQTLLLICPHMTEEQILELEIAEFERIFLEFNNFSTAELKLKAFINIEGSLFYLNGNVDNFSFSVGQMIDIQKYIKKHPSSYFQYVLAILYKNEDTNIEQRAELFKKVTVDYALPFLTILQEKYGTK